MNEAEQEIGKITWHSTEDDGGPDVGISMALSGGKELWCGEITNASYRDSGAQALGSDGGWWIILYEKDSHIVVGKCIEEEPAHRLFEALAASIRAAS